MKNSKLRKVLLLACSAVLLVCLSVGATLAYLTSQTEVVENTFTVGQVKITLDEVEVNTAGQAVDKNGEAVEDLADAVRTTKAQSYKLFPNGTYDKDPTIHVDPISSDAYLRVIVTVTNMKNTDELLGDRLEEVVLGLDLNKWTVVSNTQDKAKDVRTYVLTLNDKKGGMINGKSGDLVLFTGIHVPSDLDNADIKKLDNTTMTFKAEAIQADGFADATAAWAAFDKQMAPVTTP